jgi:bifunctional UDP-N-acetylglucosamine pyrophosphorylase/glucosamine-1-phosphate N-acetyltransferase
MSPIHVCILAAGQSTRMKSKLSKMLHPLSGKPMIFYIHEVLSEIEPDSITLVVGYQRDQIMNAMEGTQVEYVIQKEQLGTAHAVSEYLLKKPSIEGLLLVLNGDTPLIRPRLLQEMIEVHRQSHGVITLVTTEVEQPQGYGRVIRNVRGDLQRIVEETDASDEEKKIQEVNAGIYLFDLSRLRELIPMVEDNNRQREYYLPDIVAVALQKGEGVLPIKADVEDVMGINNRAELAAAARILRLRLNDGWMRNGVTMHDPEHTFIDTGVRIASDVVLYPNVYLEGSTVVESDVIIYPNTRIRDSFIGPGCVIYENCSIESARLESGVKLGPFARVRPETHLGKDVRIGNFVELKKTSMQEGSKANHLSYLGDATIGKSVNVGAGTITCNYDGVNKHPTKIEDEVFIGSDTQLIAPVTVGKGAYIAAGSSITENVPPGSLAIARSRQVNKEGWVAQKKKKK